jgi:hypothetical protein
MQDVTQQGVNEEGEQLELGKTSQEYETEINEYIKNANQAAIENNWKKAEGILTRASVVSKRFFGGQSLEFASVLSKLAAVQETLGESVSSKLTWAKALFIWEINRTGRVKQTLQAQGKKRKKKTIALVNAAKFNNNSNTKAKRRVFNLEQIFACPHHTMQYVDGSILYGRRITARDLTPRTKQILEARNVDPNIMRIRDFHSFFLAHPKMDAEDRKKYFVRWSQRREILMKELREDLQALQLNIESKDRMFQMEEKIALEAEARKARFFGLNKVKRSTDAAVPKSVLPTRFDHQFRGMLTMLNVVSCLSNHFSY